MFTWVGNQFNAILNTYVLGVVSSLMTAIAPVALDGSPLAPGPLVCIIHTRRALT